MSWLRNLTESLALMLGKEPGLPKKAEMSDEALRLFAFKRTSEEVKKRREQIRREKDAMAGKRVHGRWRNWRWASIILINLMFVVSFRLDVQLVEGALTASRFVGFHMADVNAALQVMLAHKEVMVNLVIGTVTVALLWWLVGGRAFCSWCCPYHLLGEWAEMLHLKLAAKGWAKDHALDRRMRTVLYVIFVLLAIGTGYTVFETISPVGIVSRAITYGGGIALVWVVALLLIEIFYSRRFWCRYACPIGLTYGALGAFSPLKVTYDAEKCLHEGECRKVCMVPHVLSITKMGFAREVKMDIGADCTRCAMCIETCPTGALKFKLSGLGDML